MFPNEVTRHKLGYSGHNKIWILQILYLVFFQNIPATKCLQQVPQTQGII